MSSGLSLQVILWVPVTVKYDNRVCSGEVYTKTSSTCRQQETEILHTHEYTLHMEINNVREKSVQIHTQYSVYKSDLMVQLR